jgi:integrase
MTDRTLPSYLNEVRGGYYYDPSKAAVRAGIVKRKYFPKDKLEDAIKYTEENQLLVAEWRKTYKKLKRIPSGEVNVNNLIYHYFTSSDYNLLHSSTKSMYKNAINRHKDKNVKGLELGLWGVKEITPPLLAYAYEREVNESGVYAANEFIRLYRVLFNYGIRHGFITYNPFSYVKMHRHKARKVMWKREDVRAFLNTAFSKWEWRNVGILFYCIYEWGQRPGDICKLKWENVDLDNKIVTITQSKRGSTVKLPISTGLVSILRQQQEEFFKAVPQTYIAPKMVRKMGKWVPYTSSAINDFFLTICNAAGLPKELQLRDLRRTAITETIENGADALQVMMLSGHQSVASVMPYFVHTLKGAVKAQTIRDFPATLVEGGMVKKRYGFDKEKPNAQPVQA